MRVYDTGKVQHLINAKTHNRGRLRRGGAGSVFAGGMNKPKCQHEMKDGTALQQTLTGDS